MLNRFNECRWMRILAVLFVAFAVLACPAPAQTPPTAADLPALTNLVNEAWNTNQFMARAAPPGLAQFNNDLGIIAAGSGLVLTNLPFVISLAITNYPLTILESNTTPRTRIYLNATGGIFQTLEVPAGHTSNAWSQSVYGNPGSWMTSAELSQWYADRDPARQHVTLSLISTSDIPAYLSALTNAIGSITEGGTSTPLHILFSNETLIVRTDATDNFRTMYLHAPASVTGFSVYVTANLLAGWGLAARLPHNNDPLAYNYFTAASNIFFTLGKAQDTDGDGLSDSDEILLFGTSHETADTDGDGLTDREERMQYGSSPTNWSSAHDGLSDYWKAKIANLNPNVALDASAIDDDGLTKLDRQRLNIGTQRVTVVDLGPNEVAMDFRSQTAERHKVAFAAFTNTSAISRYYLNLTVTGGQDYLAFDEWSYMIDINSSWTITRSADAMTGLSPLPGDSMSYTGDWYYDAYSVPDAHVTIESTSNTNGIWTTTIDATGSNSNGTGYADANLEEDIGGTLQTTGTLFDTIADGGWWFVSDAPGHCYWTYDDDTLHFLAYGTSTIEPTRFVVNSSTYAWTNEVLLTNEYTTAMLTNNTRTDLLAAPGLTNFAWGTGWTHKVSYGSSWLAQFPVASTTTNYTTARTNACRLISGDESSNMVSRIQYRIRLTNTVTGIVYRATVAHVFTPTNGTVVVVSVTNFLALGTGTNLTFVPTNGITINPPTSNGTIHPLIAGLRFTNSTTIFVPQTGEVATINIQNDWAELGAPSDLRFELRIVRPLKGVTNQHIAWLVNERACDFSTLSTNWDGVNHGPAIAQATGPDRFEGVSNGFNRILPAIPSNQCMAPPYYEIIASAFVTSGTKRLLSRAKHIVAVPQLVVINMATGVVSMLQQPVYYGTNLVIPAYSTQDVSNLRAVISEYLTIFHPGCRIAFADETQAAQPFSEITISADTLDPTFGHTLDGITDYPNIDPSDEAVVFPHTMRHRCYLITALNQSPFLSLPVNPDELNECIAIACAHEFGHLIGLVMNNDVLGGDAGRHDAQYSPTELMNAYELDMNISLGRTGDWSIFPLNQSYSSFVIGYGISW